MTQPPLGQRLKQWREANGLSIEDVAGRLNMLPLHIAIVERNSAGPSNMVAAIEGLITPTALTNEERWLVDQIVAAIRAGYVVSLIRPVKVDEGQIVLTFGDDA
jgi:transcriptional regulator with XRE-family HTH domain